MPSLISQIDKAAKLARWPSPADHGNSRLALDIAMRIRPLQQICDDYDITAAQLKARLQADKQLGLQVTEYKRIWSHPMNAAERVRVKAAAMAEDALHDVWQILTNADANPSVRLDAHKHLSRLADVEPKKEQDIGGSRFSVTIMLPGSDELKVTAPAIEEAAAA